MSISPQHTGAAGLSSLCFLSPGARSLEVLSGDTRRSGGAEAQVARIAASFAARGHAVTLIYGSGGDGAVTRVAGVRCIDGFPAWSRPATIARFWRTLGELRPALIYARLPDDFLALAGLFAALHPGSQLVYGLANDGFANPWRAYDYNPWFHNPLYALGLRSASVVAVQHQGQVSQVRRHTGAAIVEVPNLAPERQGGTRPFAGADIDAIWVAQIRPEKRLPVLLELAMRLPELRFAVVGGFVGLLPPAEEARLQAQLEGAPNVEFFGQQPADAVAALLARSKVLVNTSSGEGFPNTMLEAWGLGVPVVSLGVDPGGVIARERLGLVSASVEALAADLRSLSMGREANEACGLRGAAYVRAHHSPEALHRAFERIVALAGRPERAAQGRGA